MEVNESIVVQNLGMMAGDKSHTSHICGERVDLVNLSRRHLAIRPKPQVKNFKLVGIAGAIFWIFDVHSPNPVAMPLEKADQVMADEPTGAGDENVFVSHIGFLS
jgi:hypothetical protein